MDSPEEKFQARVAELGDWRAELLTQARAVVLGADAAVEETWKWAKATSPGVPVWECEGILCTGESYKTTVKLTFAQGASLPDPAGLFNSSLEGNVRRAIDWREGDQIDEEALADLVRAAIEFNRAKRAAKKR